MAEKQPAQRLIMLCTSIGFVALLAVSGFDRRFAWSAMSFICAHPDRRDDPCLIWRLLDEERFLATNLSGYIEYQKRSNIVSCRSCGSRGRPVPLRLLQRELHLRVSLFHRALIGGRAPMRSR